MLVFLDIEVTFIDILQSIMIFQLSARGHGLRGAYGVNAQSLAEQVGAPKEGGAAVVIVKEGL